MSAIPHHYWDGVNHPYRMLEKHYCEESWNLVKENKVSVWGSFEPVEIGDEIDWGIDPFDNDTWCFYFNGLNWIYSYLWAVDHLNENPERIFDIITQYDNHIRSENANKMVWFDHATSDRLSIFVAVYLHPSKKSSSGEFDLLLQNLIIQHIDKIIQFKDSKNWVNSNHGIFHALALANAGMLDFVNEKRPSINQDAIEYLSDTLLSILSLEEYFSLEQSAYYHQLAISLLESLEPTILKSIGINKKSFISKMKDANYWITSTNKKLVAMGDTSAIANIEEKYACVVYPKTMATSFLETGFSAVKYHTNFGWNYFSFLHQSDRAPHGHFDALSISLSKGNQEFIIDSGGPYRYGNTLRFRYFMSSYAHNVAIINGKKHESGAKLIGSELLSENIFIVEAEHAGYFPLIHNRKCVYVKNKGLAVIDSFSGVESQTNVQLLWHLHPDCEFKKDYEQITNGNQTIWIRNNISTTKSIVSGIEGDSPQGWITPRIGEKEPCPTLIETIDIDKNTTITTYFEYEEGCLDSYKDAIENNELQPSDVQNTVAPFGFNAHTIEKYISNDPMFWKPGNYFADRNIWKINKSQQKLAHLKLSKSEKSERIKQIIDTRIEMKIPTIYIISNGGSGCHFLGGLISMRTGYNLIDEVYFPELIINNLNHLNFDAVGLIEMVNFVHMGNLAEDSFVPINTMHLRRDVPLKDLAQNSTNPKFIFLIRNPVDIAISRGLRKSNYKMQNKENKDVELNEYLERQAKFTKNHFKRLFSEINNVGALVVRYEDLVHNPKETLIQIFSHIGDEQTEQEIDNMLAKYNSASDITKNENRSSKPELTEIQKKILNTELTECCKSLGYDIPSYAKL